MRLNKQYTKTQLIKNSYLARNYYVAIYVGAYSALP